MKISFLSSILSCIIKSIRIRNLMVNKKIIFGLFLLSFLGACGAPTAMIGPAYTLTSTGNLAQAGLSYGSNKLITNYTGKTPLENLEKMTSNNVLVEKNIKKQTLESDDFQALVINNIKMIRGKIKLFNQ